MQLAQKEEYLEGATLLLVPILSSRPEILLLCVPKEQVATALESAEKIGASFTHWQRHQESRQNEWKLNSLASVIELTTQIECAADLSEAHNILCAEIARKLGCNSVALASSQNSRLHLDAVSGVTKLDPTSETFHLYEQAMHETLLREDASAWPPRSTADDVLLLAHKQLAFKLQCESVYSQLIRCRNGEIMGVLLLSGKREILDSDRLSRFINVVTSRVGDSLALVRKSEPGRLKRTLDRLARFIPRTAWCWIALSIVLLTWLLQTPMTYHVRTDCEVAPSTKRFSVAPFDGIVEKGFVKPGDEVFPGDPLAHMDGKMIQWELSATVSELDKYRKQHKIELAKRKIPESLLSKLELQRLDAKQQSLQYQRDNIRLRSPIHGVVLKGSLERAEGASVSKGEVLYEIAPVDQLRIEIFVPAEEIPYVAEGMNAQVWIQGREQSPIHGKIARIYPQSEIRNRKNIFRCEIQIDNSDGRLRPGFKGTARIDGPKNSLAWNLFHKPWGFLKSRLGW